MSPWEYLGRHGREPASQSLFDSLSLDSSRTPSTLKRARGTRKLSEIPLQTAAPPREPRERLGLLDLPASTVLFDALALDAGLKPARSCAPRARLRAPGSWAQAGMRGQCGLDFGHDFGHAFGLDFGLSKLGGQGLYGRPFECPGREAFLGHASDRPMYVGRECREGAHTLWGWRDPGLGARAPGSPGTPSLTGSLAAVSTAESLRSLESE